MKKLTREQLQADAARLMKAHKAKEIFATADGNFFFKEHDAKNHNGTLNKPGETENCKVEKFTTDGAEAATPVATEKELMVITCRNAVSQLEKKLGKAAAKNKAAVQLELDAAKGLLTDAEKAFEEEKANAIAIASPEVIS